MLRDILPVADPVSPSGDHERTGPAIFAERRNRSRGRFRRSAVSTPRAAACNAGLWTLDTRYTAGRPSTTRWHSARPYDGLSRPARPNRRSRLRGTPPPSGAIVRDRAGTEHLVPHHPATSRDRRWARRSQSSRCFSSHSISSDAGRSATPPRAAVDVLDPAVELEQVPPHPHVRERRRVSPRAPRTASPGSRCRARATISRSSDSPTFCGASVGDPTAARARVTCGQKCIRRAPASRSRGVAPSRRAASQRHDAVLEPVLAPMSTAVRASLCTRRAHRGRGRRRRRSRPGGASRRSRCGSRHAGTGEVHELAPARVGRHVRGGRPPRRGTGRPAAGAGSDGGAHPQAVAPSSSEASQSARSA